MSKVIMIGANREVIHIGVGDLVDVLSETSTDQAEAIALRLSELTGAKSRERHPITFGLEAQ
jgi:hypothetical protein